MDSKKKQWNTFSIATSSSNLLYDHIWYHLRQRRALSISRWSPPSWRAGPAVNLTDVFHGGLPWKHWDVLLGLYTASIVPRKKAKKTQQNLKYRAFTCLVLCKHWNMEPLHSAKDFKFCLHLLANVSLEPSMIIPYNFRTWPALHLSISAKELWHTGSLFWSLVSLTEKHKHGLGCICDCFSNKDVAPTSSISKFLDLQQLWFPKRHTAPEVHFTNVSQFFKSFECSFAIVDNKSILTLDACLCFNPVSGQFCRWTGQNLNSLLDLKQFLIPPHPLDVLYLSDMKRLVTLTAGASTMTSA